MSEQVRYLKYASYYVLGTCTHEHPEGGQRGFWIDVINLATYSILAFEMIEDS